MVEQVSTMAVPLTPPKMAPAETVRMKAAAIGTTCATQSAQRDGGGRRRGEGSGRGCGACRKIMRLAKTGSPCRRSWISVISIDTNCTQEVCQGKRLSTQAASSTPG